MFWSWWAIQVALQSPLDVELDLVNRNLGIPDIITCLVVKESCHHDHISYVNNSHPQNEGLELEY